MVDYKTIVSTTDSKVTLMKWLQSLAKEFDNAKITDIAFSNDGNSALTFTFKLTDGTTKTATCKAVTLTDDEKTIVSGLVGQVATSSDGITFSKAVTFAGNIVTKGNEIHNGYASFLGDESHAGTEIHKGQSTFTDLRTDDITSTDGQDLLSYDGTNTALKGKATRPLYNSSEMALLSDVGNVSATVFWANFGIRRWEGAKYESADGQFSDALLKYCTDYGYTFCDCEIMNSWGVDTADVVIPTGTFNDAYCSYAYAFANMKNTGTLTLPSIHSYYSVDMFKGSQFTKILIADGAEAMIADEAAEMFRYCPNLVEIGAFDFSKATFNYGSPFQTEMPKLKTIHCKHFKYSFDIAFSTAFEEADLVEILNNLDTVSTTQTLTMGSTNLAKLTSDEILIATGKGWALN